MNGTARLKFELSVAGGPRQTLSVDAERALVGSGAHCEVRLSPDDSALEQLLLTARAGGLYAEARNLERPVLVNGVTFVEGRLLPESRIGIGRAELTVSLVGDEFVLAQNKRTGGSSPGIYALALIGFPLGFYLILTGGPKKSELPSAVEPPALWATEGRTPCPHAAPDAAAAFAREERLRAETRRERSPFNGQDAVTAVAAFERAAACFDVVGSRAEAEEAHRAALKLRGTTQNDFHVHRVRLERALATKRYDDARTEVRLLLGYVGRRGGAYTNWLSSLDRQIQLKFSGKKHK